MNTGVKNEVFWSEIESGFGEPGGTPPPRIPRSTPRALKAVNYLQSAETESFY